MTQLVSPSTLRNRDPILNILKLYLTSESRLLEIGSGGAEHALYFAEKLPFIHWITSDMQENHSLIKQRLGQAKLKNVHGPECLKIGIDDFPKGQFDYVFSANTLHIMSWKEAKTLFKLLGKRLREGALVFFYGPFNYNDSFTSQSNADFDQWLKARDEKSGIRSSEDVKTIMEKVGFKLLNDYEMPANNRMFVFERIEFKG